MEQTLTKSVADTIIEALPTPQQIDNQYPDKNVLGTVNVTNIHKREGAKDMLNIVKSTISANTKTVGNTDMLQLMHDTSGPTSNIRSLAQLLISNTLTEEEKMKALNGILNKTRELDDALDAFYTKQNK